MNMTETEARGKTCPHMTYCVNSSHVIEYNSSPEYANQTCQASECMAWQWDPSPMRHFVNCADKNATVEPVRPPHVPKDFIWCPCGMDPAGWIEPEESMLARRTGFCGLAGRP